MLVNTPSGSGLTGGGAVPLGGSVSLRLDSTVARTNAANTFGGNQTMPSLIVSGNAIFGSLTYNNAAVVGQSNTSVGVAGTSNSSAAVEGNSNSGIGVHGVSGSIGILGESTSDKAGAAAAVFSNSGATQSGNILIGKYNNTPVLTVDAKGDVAATGSVTIGAVLQ